MKMRNLRQQEHLDVMLEKDRAFVRKVLKDERAKQSSALFYARYKGADADSTFCIDLVALAYGPGQNGVPSGPTDLVLVSGCSDESYSWKDLECLRFGRFDSIWRAEKESRDAADEAAIDEYYARLQAEEAEGVAQ